MSRDTALAASPRIAIDSPSVRGSIALKSGRIDDLALARYHETVDPSSPVIVLFSPFGSPQPYYAEFGWVSAAGSNVKVPGPDTEWRQEGSGTLGIGKSVTLVYDNNAGLIFRRTISIDDKYLFTIKDQVKNAGTVPVTLYPYGLISRHGTPPTLGRYRYILHQGLIGIFGDMVKQTATYKEIERKKNETFWATDVWLGITDQYWAATLLPDTTAKLRARFLFRQIGALKTYQVSRANPQPRARHF